MRTWRAIRKRKVESFAVGLYSLKTVKVALAQPGDSIFGALAAGLSGFAVGLGVVWLAQFIGLPGAEGSALLSEVLGYVG